MEEFVHFEPDRPQLRDPLLLAAFVGAWGTSAVEALRLIAESRETVPLASIDPDPFFDYTVQRPIVALDGDARALNWPENRFVLLPADPGADVQRDLVLLIGTLLFGLTYSNSGQLALPVQPSELSASPAQSVE